MNNNWNKFNYMIDVVDVLSLIIGIQNMELNNKQIEELQEHLNKQDKQYQEIIKLLKESNSLRKED